MDLKILIDNARLITIFYPENTMRKNYFLAACKCWDKNAPLDELNNNTPYGGTIGIGDSFLDTVFRHFKVFRLHAVLHDSAGALRSTYNKGPGYCYALDNSPVNSCFLGHVSGLLYCLCLKVFSSYYNALEC